jgi:hypothetical protein
MDSKLLCKKEVRKNIAYSLNRCNEKKILAGLRLPFSATPMELRNQCRVWQIQLPDILATFCVHIFREQDRFQPARQVLHDLQLLTPLVGALFRRRMVKCHNSLLETVGNSFSCSHFHESSAEESLYLVEEEMIPSSPPWIPLFFDYV